MTPLRLQTLKSALHDPLAVRAIQKLALARTSAPSTEGVPGLVRFGDGSLAAVLSELVALGLQAAEPLLSAEVAALEAAWNGDNLPATDDLSAYLGRLAEAIQAVKKSNIYRLQFPANDR